MRAILVALFLLVLEFSDAFAAKRIALVIGNGDYQSVIDLKNPQNDSELIEKVLRETGFDVVRLNNLDQKGMKKALLDFGRRLKESAEASMFYYAGHGIEIDGVNYLIPIDADLQSKEEADIQGVSVDSFLNLMENSGVPLNIVILDACRNNPFRSLRSTGGGGLAAVSAPSGTYVAYSTAPGQVAADGKGNNSPFTEALAESIVLPGLQLEEVLKETRKKVLTSTNGAQTPFDSSAITGKFYFSPAGPVAETAPTLLSPNTDINAKQAFDAAGSDLEMQRLVAKEFPNTIWGKLAFERAEKLAAQKLQKQAVEPVEAETKIVEKKTEEVPAINEAILPKPKLKVAEKKKVPTAKQMSVEPPTALKPKTVQPKKLATLEAERKRTIEVTPRPVRKPHGVDIASAQYRLMTRCESNDPLHQGALCRRGNGQICKAYFIGDGVSHPRVLKNCQ